MKNTTIIKSPTDEKMIATQMDREKRAEQLLAISGQPNQSTVRLTRAIRKTAYYHYKKHILPLIKTYWPETLENGLEKKIKYLTCDYYACASYFMFFVSPKPPLLIRLFTGTANKLKLPFPVLGMIASVAMLVLGRLVYRHIHKKIIFLASFSPVADHVIEHCMDDLPLEERGKVMHGVLDKIAYQSSAKYKKTLSKEEQTRIKTDIDANKYIAYTPGLKLTEAIFQAISTKILPDEENRYVIAYKHVKAWVDSEIAIMSEMNDPTGMERRLAGIKAQIDALCIPIDKYVTDDIIEWGYTVGIFVQMIDDWIDYDDDKKFNKLTPVVSGHWTLQSIEDQLKKSIEEGKQIIIASDRKSPHYIQLLIDSYLYFNHELTTAMIDRIAD